MTLILKNYQSKQGLDTLLFINNPKSANEKLQF